MTETRYGDDKTIHRTSCVDVETDEAGQVVAVWFRCHPIPFIQAPAGPERAAQMRKMYENGFPGVKAVVFHGDQSNAEPGDPGRKV